MQRMFASYINYHYLCTRNYEVGAIAQLVEQRTENPCVPGSIPGGTTPPFMNPVRISGRVFRWQMDVRHRNISEMRKGKQG